MTYPTATTTRPLPISNTLLLAMIHLQAASVADVNGVSWVGRGHVEVRITVPNVNEQENVTWHLFGSEGPIGRWELNHAGISDEDATRVTVTVAVGGAR